MALPEKDCYMRRTSVIVSTLLLLTSVFAVSCTLQTAQDKHSFVLFTESDTRTINENVYYVSESGAIAVHRAAITPDDIYWSYRAAKTDSGFDFGSTNDEFVSLVEGEKGKGLGRTLEISAGTWKFEFRGYIKNEDRKNNRNVVYEGSVEAVVSKTAENIPIDYKLTEGIGSAVFTVSIKLIQDELDGVEAYRISKVKVYAGNQSSDIFSANTEGIYEGTIKNIPTGKTNVGYEVYIEGEDTPRAVESGTAVILNGNEAGVIGKTTINFSKKPFSITYELNGGALPEGVINPECCYFGEVITPVAPEKTGYAFKGWKVSGAEDETAEMSYTAEGKNVVLEAVWEVVEYSIVYNLYEGSVAEANPATYTVETGSIALTSPTRADYAFVGWSLNGNDVSSETKWKVSTGNLVFDAVWIPFVYTITYNLDGGTEETSNPKGYTFKTGSITLSAPSKQGNTFAGWSVNDGEVSTASEWNVIRGNIEFKAHWTPNTYSITYDSKGGTTIDTGAYTYGKEESLPTPTKADDVYSTWEGSPVMYNNGWKKTTTTITTSYTFAGWKIVGAEDETAFTKVPAETFGALELEAVWTDEKTSNSVVEIKGYSSLEVGEEFGLGTLGRYSSYTSKRGDEIIWKVLAVDSENDRALIIAKNTVTERGVYDDATSSNYKSYSYNWTDCDLKTWLNGTFITESGLKEVSMACLDESIGTVFLLSKTEATKYLSEQSSRIAYTPTGTATFWYLRNGGTNRSYSIVCVQDNGYIFDYGFDIYDWLGVRPAFWINLW